MGRVPARRPLALLAILLGVATAAVEATVVQTAVPSIVGQLGGFARFPWLFSAYLLAQAGTTPRYGRLADLYGRRPVFAAGMAAFLAGSVLCGLAGSMERLIAARFLQGLGAGAVLPVALTVVGDLYPPARRARVQGLVSGIWALAALAGPALGGFLVTRAGWPWVFFLQVPPGLLAAALLLVGHREPPPRGAHRVDLGAALLLAGGLGALAAGLAGGLAPAARAPLLAGGAAALLAFAARDRRAEAPLLPSGLLRRPVVAAAAAGGLLVGMLLVGAASLVPTFVQGVLGRPPALAGFSLSAMSLGWPLASTAAAVALARAGYRRTARWGAAFGVAGCLALVVLAPAVGVPGAMAGTFLLGAGLGLTHTACLVALQGAVGYGERGTGTAAFQLALQLGQVAGAALYGGLLRRRLADRLAELAGEPAVASLLEAVHRLLQPGGPAGGPAGLPPAERELLRTALAGAMGDAFLAVLAASLAAFSVASRLPSGPPARPAGSAGPAPGAPAPASPAVPPSRGEPVPPGRWMG